MPETRGRQRAAERAGHCRQRHHRGHAPTAGACRTIPAFGSDCGSGPASLPFQARSPGDMIMTLPGVRGASAAGVSSLESQPWKFQPWARRLSAQPWTGRPWACPPWASSVPPCSGTSFGDSTLADASTDAATGSPCTSDELEAADPAPTEPGSPLIGSACCSLTSKSPVKVDHLVTFIACEIVTGSGLTEILGSHPARFWPQSTGAAAALS